MLTVIWSGKGWVVPVATFVISLVSELLWESATGNDDYYQDHGLPLAIALWLSAGIVFAVYWLHYHAETSGNRRGRKKPRRPAWGDHAFFFVNISAWAAVLLCSGFVMLLVNGV